MTLKAVPSGSPSTLMMLMFLISMNPTLRDLCSLIPRRMYLDVRSATSSWVKIVLDGGTPGMVLMTARKLADNVNLALGLL